MAVSNAPQHEVVEQAVQGYADVMGPGSAVTTPVETYDAVYHAAAAACKSCAPFVAMTTVFVVHVLPGLIDHTLDDEE